MMLPAALRALRPHQCAKNVLVFLPLLGAHRLADPVLLARAVLAFAAFGLLASAGYVINDLRDLAADRAHPRKRARPLASGELSVGIAKALVPLLVGGAILLCTLLPSGFAILLACYFVSTIAYSVALKRKPVFDVLLLAGLYTSRIFAGGLAAGVPVSEWMASFSMFLFLSLALLKRTSELVDANAALPARGYLPVDREILVSMGTGAGYVAVLVLALYISSPDVRRLYARPDLLWALCPLVLFWISRLWLLARRGRVDDDPLVFAMKDRATYFVGGLGAIVVYLGTRP